MRREEGGRRARTEESSRTALRLASSGRWKQGGPTSVCFVYGFLRPERSRGHVNENHSRTAPHRLCIYTQAVQAGERASKCRVRSKYSRRAAGAAARKKASHRERRRGNTKFLLCDAPKGTPASCCQSVREAPARL